jgi:hypothetical protein
MPRLKGLSFRFLPNCKLSSGRQNVNVSSDNDVSLQPLVFSAQHDAPHVLILTHSMNLRLDRLRGACIRWFGRDAGICAEKSQARRRVCAAALIRNAAVIHQTEGAYRICRNDTDRAAVARGEHACTFRCRRADRQDVVTQSAPRSIAAMIHVSANAQDGHPGQIPDGNSLA